MKLNFFKILSMSFTFFTISSAGDWVNFTCLNRINALLATHDGIWAGTSGGLVFVDRQKNVTLYNKVNSGLYNNEITTIGYDAGGSLIVGNGILQRFKGSVWEKVDSGQNFEGFISTIVLKDTILYTEKAINLLKYENNQWDSVAVGSLISSSFSISAILPLSPDSIWVGASDGLYLIKNFSTSRRVLPIPINCLVRDSLGSVLCGTSGNGLRKLVDTTWTIIDTSNSEIPGNTIICMQLDSHGKLWAGTSSGIGVWDGSTWILYDSLNSSLPGNIISSIAIDKNGNVWAGIWYEHGLYTFDGNSWSPVSFNSALPTNFCFSITHDNTGKPWLSHLSGFSSYSGSRWNNFNSVNTLPQYFKTIFSSDRMIISIGSGVALVENHRDGYVNSADNYITSGTSGRVIRDKQDRIWALHGGRIRIYDGSIWHDVECAGFPDSTFDSRMVCGRDGTMYITGENRSKSVLMSWDGQVWKTLYTYDTVKGYLSDYYVSALAIDTANNLWAGIDLHSISTGGANGGIRKYNGTEWIIYDTSNSDMPSNTVWALRCDRHGNVWIGNNCGLTKFDGHSWKTYNTLNSGLPHDFVDEISINSSENIWVATHYGGVAVFRDEGVDLPSSVHKPAHSNKYNIIPVRSVKIINNYLEFNVHQTFEHLSFSIFDLAGRLICKMPASVYLSGIHKINLTRLGTIIRGVSIVTFSDGKTKKTVKITGS